MANAAWGLLNAKLQCGSNEFKFKAMGPGAADIQLEMGRQLFIFYFLFKTKAKHWYMIHSIFFHLENGKRLPLIQVPKECGFSVKQTALGLIVTVSYDGCSVKQEVLFALDLTETFIKGRFFDDKMNSSLFSFY